MKAYILLIGLLALIVLSGCVEYSTQDCATNALESDNPQRFDCQTCCRNSFIFDNEKAKECGRQCIDAILQSITN